jgi:hypothetical protein
MAQSTYGRNRTTQASPAAPAASTPGKLSEGVLYSTGLFAPRNAASKAIGTVQVKEDVVLKAGSFINLYENDKVGDGENKPIFRMQVRQGTLKSK